MNAKTAVAARTLAASALVAVATGTISQLPASAADEVPFGVAGWDCEWTAVDEKGSCANDNGDSVAVVYRDAPSVRSDFIEKSGGRVGTIRMDVALGDGTPGQESGVGVITADGTVVGPKDGDGYVTVQAGGMGDNVEVAHTMVWK